jgi:hypothetical protein
MGSLSGWLMLGYYGSGRGYFRTKILRNFALGIFSCALDVGMTLLFGCLIAQYVGFQLQCIPFLE